MIKTEQRDKKKREKKRDRKKRRKKREEKEKKKKRKKTKEENQNGGENRHAPELALPALAADGIDLVDEDDARSVFAGLLEQVSYSPGTDPDEHLDKVRTYQHTQIHA